MTASRLALICAVLLACAAPGLAMDAYTQYEVELGYPDFPMRGAQAAAGMIIWNHGAKGRVAAYTGAPPFAIKALAVQGWDVIKIDRNPAFEAGGWAVGGQRHVASLIGEIEEAGKLGYRRVIVAGQSYGGAIALEAAARVPVYGVIAMAPGTGQSTLSDGTPFMNHTAEIERNTYSEIARLKTGRALFVMPVDDPFMPGVDRAPRVRQIMAQRGIPYILVDRQVHGHGGGYSKDFLPFVGCDSWFMAPAFQPRPGEFHCSHDEFQAAAAGMGLSLAGAARAWMGYIEESGQALIIVDRQSGTGESGDFALGADVLGRGPSQIYKARPATWIADTFSLRMTSSKTVSLDLDRQTGLWQFTDSRAPDRWHAKLTLMVQPQ